MIDGQTKLFGIIGKPVTHSMSPAMHNGAFAHLGINGVYVPMEPGNLEQGFYGLQALGFIGVSVTVPFKVEIMAYLDRIDPVAQKIGAVNTLHFDRSHPEKVICTGYNTDWMGSNQALADEMTLQGSRVLVLGAGGAARAVGFGLIEAGAEVIITNRTVSKGEDLANQLGCAFLPVEELATLEADALVNTTSVGMHPNEHGIPIQENLLEKFAVVMDIVYAPLQTRLLREAAARGCRTVDGLKMLQYQGAAQFTLWTDVPAPNATMREALLGELQARSL
ncbi:shikimate dehydrogenase [Desulfobulbus rhabdoformis]|uniref:shikimate dehydrogenase n=1 Tax=Desulfobulbus rhabdoformis TaxID=34032 RepID=UPI001966047F|nr:shikimate dehydrogenase [Desulfobulbus rhabdoformis]MBM9616122.1 shikimate dehydrogenase [Desulfobulbus rhabdoformis]